MPEYTYKYCCLVLFIVRVANDSSFLARLYSTRSTLKHTLNLFPESFQLTWQYSYYRFLLSGVRCNVACAKDGWQLQVWAELGQVFPSQAEVPRTARECRLLR